MAKMLRALVALVSVTSAISQELLLTTPAAPALSEGDQVTCAVDGVRAVDDVLDAVVYTMSSLARCSNRSGTGDEVHCIVDITQTIESVNKMVNVILKAVNKCGAIKTDKPKCGIAVGTLTKNLATLTAATTGIVAKCPIDKNDATNTGGFPRKCEVNIKDSIKSLLKAVKRTISVKDGCTTPGSVVCAHNAIKLTNALVGVAEYIAGAVAKCSTNAVAAEGAGCAQMSTKVIHAAGGVAAAGTGMAQECGPTPTERLYLASVDAEESAPAASTPTFDVSGRFLAATSILAIGFMATMFVWVAGKKVANDPRQAGRQAATETYKYVDVEE